MSTTCQPESCQNCRAGGELDWQPDFEIWACGDCFAEMSMVAEAEATCPVLYEQVTIGNKSVGAIAALMAGHECAQCCPRKPIEPAAPADAEGRAA